MTRWLRQGKPTYGENIARGIERAPQALIGMLQGKELGKQLMQIAEVERAHRAWRGAVCVVVWAFGADEREEIHRPLFEGSRPWDGRVGWRFVRP